MQLTLSHCLAFALIGAAASVALAAVAVVASRLSQGPLDHVPLSPSHSNGGVALEFAEIPHGQGSKADESFHDSAALLHPDASASSSSSSSSLPLPAAASASSAGGANPNARFYQLGYYQSYFDVSTSQVCDRLLRAVFPFRGKFYRDDDGSGLGNPEKADLYGPFWICTTLIFLLAAAGNFANYIEFINTAGTGPNAAGGHNGTDASGGGAAQPAQLVTGPGVWTYDFQKVTIGASVFYAWISLVPLCVYCFLTRVASANPEADGVPQKGLVEIASLFGYGLAIMLPVCLVCIVPVSLVRWVAVGVAFAFSSFFLLFNLGTADVNNKALLPVIAAILILNFGIAVLTKFYFFEW